MGGLWVSLLIVFMASCCTMVLELVAGRILAPFIGVSLYTWTSIIGVCLAGISVGNFMGGMLADKAGSRRTLGLILLGGGLFSLIILPLAAIDLTAIIPRAVISADATSETKSAFLIGRIVVLTAILFLPPTLILGMVSPIVIKLALTDLRQTGSIAGKIYAFSTVGSIVGTFLTGFYLVSAFGTRTIVFGVAVILIGMAFVFGDLIPAARDYLSGRGAGGSSSSTSQPGSTGDGLKAFSQIVLVPVVIVFVAIGMGLVGFVRVGAGGLNLLLFILGMSALCAVAGYTVVLGQKAFAALDPDGRQSLMRATGAATGVVTVLGIVGTLYWMNPGGKVTLTRPDALNGGCYKETNYFCIKVTDVDPSDSHQVRALVLDHLIHSYNSLTDPLYLKYGYIKVYADMIEYVAQQYPQYSAFFIGGGGYTLPRQMEALRPDAKIVVSEIDPGVTETNFEMLGVDRNTKIITFNADAREVVGQYQVSGEKFDLVFGDAFNDLQIPYHLTTKEFAQEVRGMLKDDGLYLALVIDKLRGGLFIPSYTRTVQEVFPYVYILNDAPSWNSTFPNTYLVAASATPIDMARIQKITTGQGPNGSPLVSIMPKDTFDEWLRTAPSVVLTDDYAPADNLVAPLFVERSF